MAKCSSEIPVTVLTGIIIIMLHVLSCLIDIKLIPHEILKNNFCSPKKMFSE